MTGYAFTFIVMDCARRLREWCAAMYRGPEPATVIGHVARSAEYPRIMELTSCRIVLSLSQTQLRAN